MGNNLYYRVTQAEFEAAFASAMGQRGPRLIEAYV